MKRLTEKFGKLHFLKDSKELEETLRGASAYTVVTATLKYRLSIERKISAFVLLMVLSFLFIEISQNQSLIEKLNSKEAYLVPSNISNIMRVRANALSDDQIFEFAEDYIGNFTNLNYDDVEIRMRYLTRYMHPTLRSRFKTEMLTRIPFWKSNRIDQLFSFDNIKSLKRENERTSYEDESGKIIEKIRTFYKLEIWGTVKKYVDGRLTSTYREKIFMKFTTTSIKQDTSWMFEVWDIKRQTTKELEREKIVKKAGELNNAKY